MKRLIVAAILLSIVSGVFLIGFMCIKNSCDEANRLLDMCVESYRENNNATENVKKLDSYWQKKEKTLSVFANHKSLDEIESAIGSMLVYSNSKDAERFYEHSSEVKTFLHQLMEDTSPGIHSIL